MDTSILTEFAATASAMNRQLKTFGDQMPLTTAAANQLFHLAANSPDQAQLIKAMMPAILNSTTVQSLPLSLPPLPLFGSQQHSSLHHFDPLLMAAAISAHQKSISFANNGPPSSLLPFTNSPFAFFQQNGQIEELADGQNEHEKKGANGEEGMAGGTKEMPTLASLLAAAAATNGHENGELHGSPQNGPPPAKRAKMGKEQQKDRGKDSLLPPSNDRQSANSPIPRGQFPSSLISSISASFPLLAAPPPQLPSPVPAGAASSSSSAATKSAQNSPICARRRLSAISGSSSSSTATNAIIQHLPKTPQRKPAAPIPAEKKDDAYYERRRKNNDAAKRSRDQRRMKEELTAQRAHFLEQENAQLRNQIALLRAECAKYQQAILLSTAPGAAMASIMGGGLPPHSLPPITPIKNTNSSSSSSSGHVLASPTSTTNNEMLANFSGNEELSSNEQKNNHVMMAKGGGEKNSREETNGQN